MFRFAQHDKYKEIHFSLHAVGERIQNIIQLFRQNIPVQRMMSDVQKYFVYLLASKRNGTLYIGMTNNLRRRIAEHKEKRTPGFTQKYNVTRLVYFEEFTDPRYAIEREKVLKGWLRKKKVALIESVNPEWKEIEL
jgi:putative endonuclease